MVALRVCDACQLGRHEEHQRVLQSVPEGMMGGVCCPCEGECLKKDRKKAAEDFLDRALGRGIWRKL